jgi:hypothetical protein
VGFVVDKVVSNIMDVIRIQRNKGNYLKILQEYDKHELSTDFT